MDNPKKNYFDEKGNYINVENLSLREIFERGFDEGYKKGYPDGALHNLGGISSQISDISAMTDNLYNKLMGGGTE